MTSADGWTDPEMDDLRRLEPASELDRQVAQADLMFWVVRLERDDTRLQVMAGGGAVVYGQGWQQAHGRIEPKEAAAWTLPDGQLLGLEGTLDPTG